MRAVLDTNVLLRALIGAKGPTAPILSHLYEDRYTLVYSRPLLAEFLAVTRRPRLWERHFRHRLDDVNMVVTLMHKRGLRVIPQRQVTICRDPKDNTVLEAAIAGSADVVVSGDADLLALHPFEGIAIHEPVDFLRLLNEQPESEQGMKRATASITCASAWTDPATSPGSSRP